MSGTLVRQLTAQDNADHAATAPVIAAYAAACRNLTSFQTKWERVWGGEPADVSAVLARHARPQVMAEAGVAMSWRPLPRPAAGARTPNAVAPPR